MTGEEMYDNWKKNSKKVSGPADTTHAPMPTIYENGWKRIKESGWTWTRYGMEVDVAYEEGQGWWLYVKTDDPEEGYIDLYLQDTFLRMLMEARAEYFGDKGLEKKEEGHD